MADKEKETAEARAAMLLAEAEREKAAQAIITVQVIAEADRDAEKKLIAAKQVINENKIREETNADVMAYMQLKEADAEKQAAVLRYEAKLKLAEADAAAAAKRAEGERAGKMVDVNVEREKVNVEQARVEVERTSLSNKQEFESAALKFELEKLRIQADKEVRIAAAQAMARMFAKRADDDLRRSDDDVGDEYAVHEGGRLWSGGRGADEAVAGGGEGYVVEPWARRLLISKRAAEKKQPGWSPEGDEGGYDVGRK